MLPFSDIRFFLFAAMYVLLIWLLKLFAPDRLYRVVTFCITALYLVAYYRYSWAALSFGIFSYCYTCFLSQRVGHKLISAVILILPMLLFKLHFQAPLIYFAGLSFVTFRAVQTCLDHTPQEKIPFIDYFNFLFFIPSLYIGPLDRFKRFKEDTAKGFQKITPAEVMKGWELLLLGIMYKFIIAELISRYWLNSPGHETRPLHVVHDIYAYALFLFFDFAGYSAMACGMAAMIGIDLPFNFKRPFIALNPPDFWQRWHASLTSWLTDYLFRPLYKWLSQQKKLKPYPVTKQNTAIFFTLFVMGCWNGFEPNFIYSGILYAIYSVTYNTYVIQCRKKDRDVFFGNMRPQLVRYMSVFIMFNLACFALYVFSGRYLS